MESSLQNTNVMLLVAIPSMHSRHKHKLQLFSTLVRKGQGCCSSRKKKSIYSIFTLLAVKKDSVRVLLFTSHLGNVFYLFPFEFNKYQQIFTGRSHAMPCTHLLIITCKTKPKKKYGENRVSETPLHFLNLNKVLGSAQQVQKKKSR